MALNFAINQASGNFLLAFFMRILPLPSPARVGRSRQSAWILPKVFSRELQPRYLRGIHIQRFPC
jgi:hypothetical protein